MEHRPAYKRRELAQGHRIWLVYNTNDRVWNFQGRLKQKQQILFKKI